MKLSPRWLLLAVPCALAVAAGVYFLSEARRLGARIRHLEQRNESLERELHGFLEQRQDINQFLHDKVEEIRVSQEQRRERMRQALRPMPEGVRLVLAALNECLAEDGYPELRFMSAREIDGLVISDVELLERERSTTLVYLAERVTVHLDRDRGEVTLRLFGGHRWVQGEREPFPSSGWPIVLAAVQGPKWEGRLGHIIEVVGAYPPLEPEINPSARLDRDTQALWVARLDRLLQKATTDVGYRIEQIGGLEQGAFAEVVLLGYDGKTLAAAYEVRRMTVVASSAASTVELVLEEGILRKRGGVTKIDGEGYRILLPGITPTDAMDVMMGMVVSR